MNIGYTAGVFDLFHIGHLNLLKNAKSVCDRLIVGVSTDELVQEYKNKCPIIPFSDRLQIVSSLSYVDGVVAQRTINKVEMWHRLKFDSLIVGDDWLHTPKWNKTEAELNELNCRVFYFPRTRGISSTRLNEILERERKAISSI